jgi:hypothetical protein
MNCMLKANKTERLVYRHKIFQAYHIRMLLVVAGVGSFKRDCGVAKLASGIAINGSRIATKLVYGVVQNRVVA